MKKKKCLLICLAVISSLTIGGTCGCSSNRPGQYPPAGVTDVLEQGMAAADIKKADNAGQPAENSAQARQNTVSQDAKTPEPTAEAHTASIPAGSADGIDVDLTVLSKTMVYSEVYNMMASPEKYIGKTVKMKGPFAFYHDETTDKYYFACIIQDATACCAQGIEFVLTDDYVYPDDYPEVDEEICVIGVFDTYQDGNYTYCTLRNAKLI